MIRHRTSTAPPTFHSNSLLKPLVPARNRVDEIVDRIAGEIRSGRLAAGTRLPTESELMAAMGVSRTVVREAVSALRAEGLVLTRQGIGAFVAADTSRATFRIASRPNDAQGSIGDVVGIIELRLAIEVEAAALAAERATRAERTRINVALSRMGKAIALGRSAVAEDFAFHRAIAEATHNPHYASFLDFLGQHFIPRQTFRAKMATPAQQIDYLECIQRDHARIADAISSGNAGEARCAMRLHLTQSLERYRTLATASEA